MEKANLFNSIEARLKAHPDYDDPAMNPKRSLSIAAQHLIVESLDQGIPDDEVEELIKEAIDDVLHVEEYIEM